MSKKNGKDRISQFDHHLPKARKQLLSDGSLLGIWEARKFFACERYTSDVTGASLHMRYTCKVRSLSFYALVLLFANELPDTAGKFGKALYQEALARLQRKGVFAQSILGTETLEAIFAQEIESMLDSAVAAYRFSLDDIDREFIRLTLRMAEDDPKLDQYIESASGVAMAWSDAGITEADEPADSEELFSQLTQAVDRLGDVFGRPLFRAKMGSGISMSTMDAHTGEVDREHQYCGSFVTFEGEVCKIGVQNEITIWAVVNFEGALNKRVSARNKAWLSAVQKHACSVRSEHHIGGMPISFYTCELIVRVFRAIGMKERHLQKLSPDHVKTLFFRAVSQHALNSARAA